MWSHAPVRLGVATVAATAAVLSVGQPAHAAPVPPGGLITGFVGNQGVYCSLICPLAVQTVATAAATSARTPAVFLAGLQSGDVLRAIGAAAASVTGPTNAAAAATITADGTVVAPRAFNAFEVGVVGILTAVPAVSSGVPGVVAAVQNARQRTFDALNAPIVPNPPATVAPRGIVQVAVVSALNVGAAVIFPAFNEVLGATTRVPNAVAQELAATGDPVRATAAGVAEAAETARVAVSIVADAVHTAVDDVRKAADPAARTIANPTRKPVTATSPVNATHERQSEETESAAEKPATEKPAAEKHTEAKPAEKGDTDD